MAHHCQQPHAYTVCNTVNRYSNWCPQMQLSSIYICVRDEHKVRFATLVGPEWQSKLFDQNIKCLWLRMRRLAEPPHRAGGLCTEGGQEGRTYKFVDTFWIPLKVLANVQIYEPIRSVSVCVRMQRNAILKPPHRFYRPPFS